MVRKHGLARTIGNSDQSPDYIIAGNNISNVRSPRDTPLMPASKCSLEWNQDPPRETRADREIGWEGDINIKEKTDPANKYACV
jgi:hypothetical protein